MKKITLVLIAFFLFGCKPRTIIQTKERVKTEFQNQIIRDSIYLADTVRIREKGDTILVESIRYKYKTNTRTDTVIRMDSVYIDMIKEVNRLTTCQRKQIVGFWIAVVFSTAIVVYKIKRFFR